MSKGYLLLFLTLLIPCLSLAEGFGSKSMLHVQSAQTLKPRRLDFRTNMRFYTKVGDFLGQQKPSDFSTVNYWDVQANALLTYGFSEHFDASFNVRVYQDVHNQSDIRATGEPSEYNAPDDLFLFLKAGSFGFSNDKLVVGGQGALRFPTGTDYNYPLEDYTAGSLEWGLKFLFSYYNDPFLPDRDFSFHANVGWWYHNDAGKTLAALIDPATNEAVDQQADGNSSALRYGLGFSYPTDLFDLNLELWGNNFISQPDSFAFSRENYVYVTPSIRFKPRWWVNFDLGLDLRVSSDTDETSGLVSFEGQNLDIPNYASWKMTLGANFVLNPGADKLRGGVGSRATIKEKVDFYERLLQERDKTRSIEEELRRLKREREQAEKELEELRQLLDEEGGGN